MGFFKQLLVLLRFSDKPGPNGPPQSTVSTEEWIESGNSYEDTGDALNALRCYDSAIQVAPRHARAHLNRGNALQALNRLQDAIRAYETAIALNRNFSGAFANLGNAHMRFGQHAQAIAAYQEVLKLDSQNSRVLLALAAAQEVASRFPDAADNYQRCLDQDPQNDAAAFGFARSLRALNRNEDALKAVQRLLDRKSQVLHALFLKGEVLADLGRFDQAVAAFEQVLVIDPLYFLALTSLGDAQRKLDKDQAALESYKQALRLDPEIALLHMKLAFTYLSLGRKTEARAAITNAVNLDSKSSTIQFNAGNLYDELGDYSRAVTHFQQAIDLCPDAQSYNNLGNVQRKLGMLHAAISSFQQALEIDPQCAEAHSNLGIALRSKGAYTLALESLVTACRLRPQSALFQCNAATTFLDLNDLVRAQRSCQRALDLDPCMVEAHNNMGTIQLEMGALSTAAQCFQQALLIDPTFTRARHNLSHAQLAMGLFDVAWSNYEFRIDEHLNSREMSPLPQWRGQCPSEGDRILLFVEQGLGDMLQFVRYLPLVGSRFLGGVSLYATTPLISLFRRSFPNVEVLDKVPGDQSQWQWQCALLSLPLAFGTVIETIPSRVPYLIPDPVRRAKWSERIQRITSATVGTKKIGIVWRPGTGMKTAHLKATSLQTLSPLFSVAGCTWFSLQKEADPEKVPFVSSDQLIDWSADFQDFDDTAALAVNMDLVISVDTSVAHLAGGLGLPTWLLNRYASDWRWMREREDSPWYPTVRIFAQDAPGNWEGVAQRVAQALMNWVSAENVSDWRSKGNKALQSGDLAEAQRCYERGIQANAVDAACYANLGFVLMQQGNAMQAKAALLQAVALNPNDADAHYLLGNLSRNAGDLSHAVACFRGALQAKHDFDHCRRELCLALVQAGAVEDAKAVMRDIAPSFPIPRDAFVFEGTMHLAFGEYETAVTAFIAANQLEPLNADELINLGAAQLGQRNATAAAAIYQKVLETNPDHVMALYNQATALQLNGDVDSAVKGFRRALALDPENACVHQNLLSALTLSTACSPADYVAEARVFGKRVASKAVPYATWPCESRPLQGRTLRVGFVSGDLRQHPVGYFLLAAMKHLDPGVISCIAYSNAAVEDAFSQQLKPHFTEWQSVVALSDQELAEKIHVDAIDVLIDLAGHTAHNRLPVFAWRPSPVQVAWLGYWASTGLTEMDYVLADEVSLPESDARFYTEQPWYLPNTRLCFTPPDSAVQPSAPPVMKNGYVTFGSFQKLDKISDATLSAWAAVLHAIPTARFRLQSRPLAFPEVATNMLARMTRAGMDPTRLDLLGGVSRDQYLQAYSEVDIVLDTCPFPGGTTTAEALWMGVPTVTLSGSSLVARQGESILKSVGLGEWVVHSKNDYVRIAVETAADTAQLTHLRSQLRDSAMKSSFFDAKRFAADLTLALISMCAHKSGGY